MHRPMKRSSSHLSMDSWRTQGRSNIIRSAFDSSGVVLVATMLIVLDGSGDSVGGALTQ